MTTNPSRREAATQPSAKEPEAQHWAVLPVILSATFMALFDFNVVNVSAPAIERSLGSSTSELQFVVAGYAFSYAAGLITGGRLGDMFGHRRMFLWGMAAFVVASAACGGAQTSEALIAARLAQGLSAAAMVPQVLALITRLFAPSGRARALAWFGATVGLGSIAGQVMGGVLVQADIFGLGWRMIFLVNIPVGAGALVLASRLLPRAGATSRHPLDLVGVAAISGALALALVPLIAGESRGWPAWAIVMLLASVPALAIAVWHQARSKRRGREPLLDVDLFGQRSFSVGLAVNMIVYAYIGSFFLAMAVFLQTGLGLTPLRAGLTFALPALGFAIAAIRAPSLAARYGRNLVVAALALNCVALAALFLEFELSGSAISASRIVLPLTLTWIGNGLILPTMIGVVLTGVDPLRAGSAAGILTTGQQFAMAIGVALLGIIFFDHSQAVLGLQDYSSQMQRVFALDLLLMVGSLVLARLLPGRPAPAPVAAGSRA